MCDSLVSEVMKIHGLELIKVGEEYQCDVLRTDQVQKATLSEVHTEMTKSEEIQVKCLMEAYSGMSETLV